MNKILVSLVSFAVFAIAFSFIGASSVSAARAYTDKGNGCYVRVGVGDDDYVFDASCAAHDVLKLDDEGNVEFYQYQDHGQLPEDVIPPSRTVNYNFDTCLSFGSLGIVCGTINETITPSGEYKSSFNSY